MKLSQRGLFTFFSLIASTGAAMRMAIGMVLAALLGSLILASCLAQSQMVKERPLEMGPSSSLPESGQLPVTPAVSELDVGPGLHLESGLEYGLIPPRGGDDAHLVIDLAGSQILRPIARPSMSVALVIDRSGSMSGEKMQNAIAAAASFIQNLRDGDVVSIVAYDDVVEELAPPTRVDGSTRSWLLSQLNRMYPRGSTNLWGGLTTGVASLTASPFQSSVRRVILVSDGLANVGPSTPQQLGLDAANAARQGIAVTAIGVGLDYDEAILGAVARRSGGRFHHLRHPSQLASIMESELSSLSQTVARNVRVTLEPADGVVVTGATGADFTRDGDNVVLRVGDLLAGATSPVVVSLRLPLDREVALQSAAVVGLSYLDPSSEREYRGSTSVVYGVASTPNEAQRSLNPRFAQVVESHRAAMASLRAAELLDEGRALEAAQLLENGANELEHRARSLPAAERQQLSQDASRMRRRSSRARRPYSGRERRANSLAITDDALSGLNL